MRLLITILLSLSLPLSLTADRDKKVITYFQQTLIGEAAEAPSGRITPKRISKTRADVWTAWKEANQQTIKKGRSLTLPDIIETDRTAMGEWSLPDWLEPNARMPFYFLEKGEKPLEGYPVFLYLHGSGPKQIEWETGLSLAKAFQDAPSRYVIPQIPNEGAWYRWYQKSKQYAWENLLRLLLLDPSTDPGRLYLFGISEGGYGSQRLASFYADYLAGAGPMAGGEPLINAPVENLGHIAFSLRTGAEDKGFYRDLLTRYTKAALDSIAALHPGHYHHLVQLIPGRGHHIDYSPTTPWLGTYRRTPRPDSFIWEDFEMDGRHRSGFYNLLITRRPSDSLRTRYEFSYNNGRVDLNIENICYQTTELDPHWGIILKSARTYTPASGGALTLFLHEDWLKAGSPLKVYVNGRIVWEGTPSPSLDAMTRSLATFYDPERIFPYAVTIDY